MAPKAYLDTCIVSEVVKEEIDPNEISALHDLFEMHEKGKISLFVSSKVEEELNNIPEEYVAPHLEIYEKFMDLPRIEVGGITRMGLDGGIAGNPHYQLWQRLTDCLPDEPDAVHVFVSATNKCSYLITCDAKTMLSRASKVLAASGVNLVWPSEMLTAIKSNAC